MEIQVIFVIIYTNRQVSRERFQVFVPVITINLFNSKARQPHPTNPAALRLIEGMRTQLFLCLQMSKRIFSKQPDTFFVLSIRAGYDRKKSV
jgi:hypothetical protein